MPAPAPRTVALLHYTAPPVVGGVEQVLGQHARLLAEAGHAVRVVAGRGGVPGGPAAVVRVARADTGAHQGEPHGIGSVLHARAVLGAAELGELALEALHLGAPDEGR